MRWEYYQFSYLEEWDEVDGEEKELVEDKEGEEEANQWIILTNHCIEK